MATHGATSTALGHRTAPPVTGARSIFPVDNATEEEQLYFDMVDTAFAAKDEKVISNGLPAHAVYLLYKLLSGASCRVRIYTGHLQQTFDGVLAYREPCLAAAAVRFLERPGTELLVAVGDKLDVPDGREPKDHPFIRAILEAGDRVKGELRLYDASESEVFEHHFAVMDEKAFRVEVDTRKAQAYASFGDAEFAEIIAGVFDHMVDVSREIKLPAAA